MNLLNSGQYLLVAVWLVGASLLRRKPSSSRSDKSSRSVESEKSWFRESYVPLTAGAVTYGAYVSAALQAGAPWLAFLHEHLFDGLAPAFLVGILVSRYPDPSKVAASPEFRWPIIYIILLFMGGMMIFSLVAAAAVFTSGREDYWIIISVAFYGGYMFADTLGTDVGKLLKKQGMNTYSRWAWWWKESD